MMTLATLRDEAEMLARQLPDLSLQAEAADLVHPGAAGRKRAGAGEQFWQYRRYAQTDAADRIDWRRSARGDEYYVRETELETARTILFWTDPNPGFNWRGGEDRPTKVDRARILMLALGLLLSKDGERIGVLNGHRAAALGKTAPDRLAEDLLAENTGTLSPPKSTALTIVASDFYDPLSEWRTRLSALAAKCRHGVLLCVSDPIEHEFPYSGRMKFSRPGGLAHRIFGRAESVRDDYFMRLKAQHDGLSALATQMGWALVTHRTDDDPLRAAAALLGALEQFGRKA
ncbi:MAG: DUF58 domain-containing protein [Pseudomonadota bacterium]